MRVLCLGPELRESEGMLIATGCERGVQLVLVILFDDHGHLLFSHCVEVTGRQVGVKLPGQ